MALLVIAILHAKDFVVETSGLRTVRAGQGQFHYAPLMRSLQTSKPGISILLEEAGEDTAEECANFLRLSAQS